MRYRNAAVPRRTHEEAHLGLLYFLDRCPLSRRHDRTSLAANIPWAFHIPSLIPGLTYVSNAL